MLGEVYDTPPVADGEGDEEEEVGEASDAHHDQLSDQRCLVPSVCHVLK